MSANLEWCPHRMVLITPHFSSTQNLYEVRLVGFRLAFDHPCFTINWGCSNCTGITHKFPSVLPLTVSEELLCHSPPVQSGTCAVRDLCSQGPNQACYCFPDVSCHHSNGNVMELHFLWDSLLMYFWVTVLSCCTCLSWAVKTSIWISQLNGTVDQMLQSVDILHQDRRHKYLLDSCEVLAKQIQMKYNKKCLAIMLEEWTYERGWLSVWFDQLKLFICHCS